MTNEDWASIAKPIGLELLGEPKAETSAEVRWGTHGSWVLNKEKGQFYSFELDQGGGTMWLLKHFDQSINETLKRFGFGDEGAMSDDIHFISPKKEAPSSPSLTRDQFVELWLQASIKIKYSDEFAVLRFPEGHPRSKIKYAPFSKRGDLWYMKRPEGLMPLYLSDRSEDKPVLIVEGEKAAIAAEQIYAGQVACHHGGCKGWDKTDWSSIYGRQVYIYPDNDEAGLMFAAEIGQHLRANGCNVITCQPHKDLPEKGDLHEANELNLYLSSDELEDYILGSPAERPRGAFYVEPVSRIIQQVDEPNWLIDDVIEQESLVSVFGAPKSGKSFVAIAMAASIASGNEFFGHGVKKKSSVLYVAGEGLRGIRSRCSILDDRESLADAPFYISNRTVRINDDADFTALIAEIEMIVASHGELNLLVLDTFQRVFSGNENSSEDVGGFISKLDKLIADYKCCVLMVHHTGHGNADRARGSSVIPASLDNEFKVVRDKDSPDDEMHLTFEQTLNKDSLHNTRLAFKLVDHSVTINDKKISSAYLEKIEFNFDADDDMTWKLKQVWMAFEAETAVRAAEKGVPEHEIFLTQSDFYPNRVKLGEDDEGNSIYMNKDQIKYQFNQMVKKKLIYTLETIDGYQKYEFKNIIPMMG
jgi:5S rRNA maturation endonuclease (ribonuclease M5)